ncbi:MAG: metalloregulator ArsR/SmtB family transcription factor [Thermomicrobia bacterium]|nr:metalloregulator ArsR/SmtB family transcription factor [Thermomicrobia bacterium]
MGDEEQQIALRFFRALADESRLKIVGLLANGERGVDELADALRLKAPTVSHHLAKLREAGFVQMRAQGTVHLYRLDANILRQMSREILTPERIASLVDDAEGDVWERKVLRQSFVGDRLKQIPVSRKKRDVILTWLAGRFTPGRRYPEKEVNAIIMQHHDDYATLRRELIDGGWMEREGGVYWLVDGDRKPHGGEELVRLVGEDGVR